MKSYIWQRKHGKILFNLGMSYYNYGSWAPVNQCFRTVLLEKIHKSPLDCMEIKPDNPEGNQFWIFIGRTDAEAEAPLLWPPDVKSWLVRKDLMLGKIEGRRKRGWQRMRWLDGITDNGRKFEQPPGDGEGQRSLACCSSWGHKVAHNLANEQQQ